MADTLGSVGVIISTLLIYYFHWTGFDPIASLLIGLMILGSVVPLVIDCGRILCLDLTSTDTGAIELALSKLTELPGVVDFSAVRFWPLDGGSLVGSIHIQARSDTHGEQDATHHTTTIPDVSTLALQVEKLLKHYVPGLESITVQLSFSYDSTSKGSIQDINGTNCYVVGDQTATKAIVAIYDIFGFHSSTEQGADIIAALTGCRVYIPDLFDAKPLPLDTIPADTPEKEARMSSCKIHDTDQVFTGLGAPTRYTELLTSLGYYLKNHGCESVGLYGLCWGSKPAALVLIHASLLEPNDAKKIMIPTANFISPHEDNDVIRAFNAEAEANPSIGSTFVTHLYPNTYHGFAGARANLEDDHLRASFQDVYQRTAKFLLQHLA